MTYDVRVTSDVVDDVSATASTWTEVRACVGNAVEVALGTLPPGKGHLAYAEDVMPLNMSLTSGEVEQEVEAQGWYRVAFQSVPLTVTITKR
ncbi:hypothetical protein OHA74_20830 [Streptomyces phaeochromogenes]|uniref:hypothetical protein n=1 Tax=Streptomyces phaeochromogenes TaxID=1923 RepID=UPI002E2B7EB6|nr:hypothetical protein [Streptomyces phaeochromogenes]